MVEQPEMPVPARGHRWRWPVRATIALLVLAALAAAGVLVAPRAATSAFTTPADELVAAATARLRSAPLLRYRGSYLDPAGHLVRLAGDVARSGAAVVDLRSANGGTARLAITGSGQYLNGDDAWYLEQDPTDAGEYEGAWITVDSPQLIGADIKRMLAPATLAETLRYAPHGRHELPNLDMAYRPARVSGVLAAGVPTASTATAYVTAQRPYRLVGVDGPLFGVAGLRHGKTRPGTVPQVSLTVSEPAGAARKSALARIGSVGSEASAKATDTSHEFGALHISFGDPPCYYGEPCRFLARIRRDGTGSATAARYLFMVAVSTSPGGSGLGSCQASTKPLGRNESDTVSCRVGGQLTNWSGSFWRRDDVINATYFGAETQAYVRLFVADDLDTLGDLASSPEAVGVADAWSSDPGWTVPSLADMLTTASSEGLLRPLFQLATSGSFVDDSATATTILRAINSDPASRYRTALLDAGGRAGRTSGKVALGSWQAGDGHTYRADVIDTGAHQMVAEAPVTSVASVPATAGTIRSAAARLGSAPKGYTRVVHLVLAPGHRLYRDGAASLRDSLRAAGLTAGDLAGADLSVTTAGGTVTLHPSDFR